MNDRLLGYIANISRETSFQIAGSKNPYHELDQSVLTDLLARSLAAFAYVSGMVAVALSFPQNPFTCMS